MHSFVDVNDVPGSNMHGQAKDSALFADHKVGISIVSPPQQNDDPSDATTYHMDASLMNIYQYPG